MIGPATRRMWVLNDPNNRAATAPLWPGRNAKPLENADRGVGWRHLIVESAGEPSYRRALRWTTAPGRGIGAGPTFAVGPAPSGQGDQGTRWRRRRRMG